MKTRSILIAALAAYALLLTAGVAAFLVKRGGVAYVLEGVGLRTPDRRYVSFQVDDLLRFGHYPSARDKTVFLGDSITADMRWAEYYSPLQNRGIGGDTSSQVLTRIAPIAAAGPRQLFLNIGTNDLGKDVGVDQVRRNIVAILETFRKGAGGRTPELYLISVLPNNPDFADTALMRRKVGTIKALNAELAKLDGRMGVRFIDVYSRFTDGRSYLREDLTPDGTHLNEKGKALYARILAPYVKADR